LLAGRAGAEASEVRARKDAEVVEEIWAAYAELRARGRTVNRKRVARQVRMNGIVARSGPPGSAWLCLATVIDICSRRVVGW
jgi:transposase InsO family protein